MVALGHSCDNRGGRRPRDIFSLHADKNDSIKKNFPQSAGFFSFGIVAEEKTFQEEPPSDGTHGADNFNGVRSLISQVHVV